MRRFSRLTTIGAALLFTTALASPLIACEDGHWIGEVLAGGKIIKLEDGSIWKVEDVDTATSSIWLPVSDVLVCDDKIVNVDDGESVGARRIR